MGRINGANSDYKFSGGQVVEQISDPLYLKIYICPNDEKSPLQTDAGYCIGTDEDCPGSGNGHAMLHLNKDEGVEIVVGDKNKILVKQNGDIELGKESGPAKIILKDNGEIIINASTVSLSGNLNINGNISANNL